MPKLLPLAICVVAAAVAGCGSDSKKAEGTTPKIKIPPAKVSAASYRPKIVPSEFTTNVTSRYWPMKRGTTWIYDGEKDGVPEHVVVTVKPSAKTIMGVRTVTIQDTVTINKALEEQTTDWYAQDAKGNVWYFGEDSKDYRNGAVVSTQGTWEAGVDGAQPGIVVKAHPRTGEPPYRQEFRPGVAEDMAKIVGLSDAVAVPAGSFKSVLHTLDTDPLNPDKIEHKWYAPGIGPVHVRRQGSAHTEEIKLVKVVRR
jgi:hypothetical protein